jgi:putative spermidine/putrescine transport system substrate-binding protein
VAGRAARLAILAAVLLAACGGDAPRPAARLTAAQAAALPWDSVLARARGTRVVWTMWRGDPSINRFVDGWVAPRLRERYGITLTTAEGQGADLVNALVVERDAGRDPGTASLVWINGEAFANLRRTRLLFGPWAGRLPNAAYVDSASPIIARDFEQDPAGHESPWGTVQFAMIYDTVRTPSPPRTYGELGAYVRAHPGRFVHDQGFTGLTFLKGLMYARAGGVDRFRGGFRDSTYAAGRDAVFAWLDSTRARFWRGGRTYPDGVAELPPAVRQRRGGLRDVQQPERRGDRRSPGRAPRPTARAYVLARRAPSPTRTTSGIPHNAPNPGGRVVVADFLLSPEAQLVEAEARGVGRRHGARPRAGRRPSGGRGSTRWRGPAEQRSRPSTLARLTPAPEVAPPVQRRLLADWRERVAQAVASAGAAAPGAKAWRFR